MQLDNLTAQVIDTDLLEILTYLEDNKDMKVLQLGIAEEGIGCMPR